MASLNLPDESGRAMLPPILPVDDAYLNFSAAVAKGELEMARIQANKATALAEIRRRARESRQPFIGGILAGVAVLLFLLAIVGAVSYASEQDRVKTDRENVRQAQIAVACIAASNIWINGNCVPSRKSP